LICLAGPGWPDHPYHQIIQPLNKQNMKKNMGNTDRIVRLLVAAVIAVLYFTNMITGTLAIVLLVIAGIFVATSLISFCPLYAVFGLNTCAVRR
jgi:fatty acid desaturase